MSRFIFTLAVLLGITPFSAAKFTFGSLSTHTLTPGQVITLNWTPTSNGDVSLSLQSQDSDYSATIIDGTTNIGAFTWTVPSNIPSDSNYVINIWDDKDSSNNGVTDSFSVQGSSSSVSTSASTSATDPPSSSTSTTLTTAVSTGGNTPTTTQSDTSSTPTDPASTSSPSSIQTSTSLPSISSSAPTPAGDSVSPNGSGGGGSSAGLSSSARTAIIVSCVLVAVLGCCVGLFFVYRRRRHRRSPGSETTLDSGAEKGYSENKSGYMSSPTISQGVRNSQTTQDSGLWHYKPELPGSDPKRESSSQFLAPVELPAWEPRETDPLAQTENDEHHDVHEKDDDERCSRHNAETTE